MTPKMATDKVKHTATIGPHPHDPHHGGFYVAFSGQTYLHVDGVWRHGTYQPGKGYTGYFPTKKEAEEMLEKVGMPEGDVTSCPDKVNAPAVSQLARERTPGIFEATEFTLADGRPFETVEEVIATTTLSASHGGTRLFGVTIKDDTNQPPKVVCYTGNGPASEGNAKFIAEAVNLSAALSEREEKVANMGKLIELQGQLLVCYRMQKRPPEKLLDGIQKVRAALGE